MRRGEGGREKMSPVMDIFMRIRTHHYLSLLSGGHSLFLSVSIIGERDGSTSGGGPKGVGSEREKRCG